MTIIRVLHLITRLPVGGAERLLADVVHSLDSTRFESIVCCIRDGGMIAEQIAATGVPVVTLGLMQHGGFDRQVIPRLCELIREHRIDLVHSHLYHANLYGRLAAARCGVAAIASVHNTYVKRKWYRHLINRWLGRRSAAVIAVSEDIRRDIERHDHIPSGKVVVIPNGIDISRIATTLSPLEAKRRLGFSEDHFLLGCVGRLEEQKGHAYLLSAMAELRPSFPQLRLAIAGDGRKRTELIALADRLGLADVVTFLGVRDDMAAILRAFDVYVMPSLWEGLSLAMLEAMAAALPVLISDVGGAAEVLGENEFGRRVAPGNVGALCTELRLLIESPELRQDLARKAKQRVESRYDAKIMIRRLEDLYAKAVAEGKS